MSYEIKGGQRMTQDGEDPSADALSAAAKQAFESLEGELPEESASEDDPYLSGDEEQPDANERPRRDPFDDIPSDATTRVAPSLITKHRQIRRDDLTGEEKEVSEDQVEATPEVSPDSPVEEPLAEESTRVEQARRLLGQMKLPAERVAQMEPKEILEQADLLKPYHDHVSTIVERLSNLEKAQKEGEVKEPGDDALPSIQEDLDSVLTSFEENFDADVAKAVKPLVNTAKALQTRLDKLEQKNAQDNDQRAADMVRSQLDRLEQQGYELSDDVEGRLVEVAVALAQTGKYNGDPTGAFDAAALVAFGGPPKRKSQGENQTRRKRGRGVVSRPTNGHPRKPLTRDQKMYQAFSDLESRRSMGDYLE